MLNIIRSNRMRANGRIDGKQQKKRGPKTDSKPALNSKQEKNRQAQRYASPLFVMCFSPWSFFFWVAAKTLLSDTQPASNKSHHMFDVGFLSLMLTFHLEITVRESLRTP